MKKLILLIGLLWFGFASGQTKYYLQADTFNVKIGEPISITHTVDVAGGSVPIWPVLPDSLGVVILELDTLKPQSNGEITTYTQKWAITSYDSGYVDLQLSLLLGGDTLLSNPLFLGFEFPEVKDDESFFDIKGTLGVAPNWLKIILLIVIVLVLIFILVKAIINLRQIKAPEQQVFGEIDPKYTPWEWAYMGLDKLNERDLTKRGSIKEYYTELVDILRVYIENQMAIKAMESTAAELVDKIEGISLEKEFKKELNTMLLDSALVKYAKILPSEHQNERAFELVKQFVDVTKTPETANDV